MKILSLVIENFLAIGKAELSLADKGLVLIQGDNKDDPSASSNGAGKSSVCDAIFWCLEGETGQGRGVTGDGVVNRTAGKGTRVAALIEDGDLVYEIARHRKHKTFKNSVTVRLVSDKGTAVDEDLTKGTDKLTQAVVDRILGCSMDVFKAAIYAAQEALPDLPKMTDRQLKAIIEEAAGATVFERAYEIARTKLKDASTAVEEQAQRLSIANSTIVNAEAGLQDISDAAAAWEAKRKTDVKAAVEGAQEALSRAKAVVVPDDTALKQELADCEAEIAAVSSQKATLADFDAELTRTQREADLASQRFRMKAKEANDRKADLDNIVKKVGVPCGECGKPVEEHDLDTVREHAKKTLMEAVDAARAAKVDAGAAASTLADAREARDSYAVTMTDVSATSARAQKLRSEIAAIDQKRTEAKQHRDEATRLAQDAKKLQSANNPHDGLAEKTRANIETLKAKLPALEKTKAAAIAAQEVVAAAVDVFGPAGVRAHILDTVTPFLNDRTGEYLSVLSDGMIHASWSTLTRTAKGELREKFAIEVEKPGYSDSFAGLSGGEKRKVRLACALALQDLVASRATKPIELWIGDEIDLALDPSGLERLMSVLEGKARERGTVLVVSHNALHDWIRDVATVTMEDKIATVSGVLNGA